MSTSSQGQRDHRAVELYERMATRCKARKVPITPAVERLITAAVIEDAAIRFWERRGYKVKEVGNAD